MYVELVERNITNRGTVVELNQVSGKPAPYERYMSLYPFDKNIVEYVKLKKTVRDYKGLHYIYPALFVDIDYEEDVEQAQMSTLELVNRLNSEYGVSPQDLYIYFSGGKGFHVGIPTWMIGCKEPEEGIAERCKKFVTELAKGINHIDYKIYEDMRIFRIVNSLNAKKNLYKIPLTMEDLLSDLALIRTWAKEPRPDFVRDMTQKTENKKLSSLWHFSVVNPVFTKEEIKNAGLFSAVTKGGRNNKAFDQAIVLLKAGIHRNEVWNVISNFNNQNDPPMPEAELRVVFESALKTAVSKDRELDIRTIGGFVPDWLDGLKEEKNKISLKFPLLDYEMKGKLRGKLGLVIHYGGTKKSLLAQNICHFNVFENEQRAIYSSMEMSVQELISRFVDMTFTIEGVYENASSYFQKVFHSESQWVVDMMHEKFSKMYKDRLIIIPNSAMNTELYKRAIDKTINESGPVDILVVDGLGMMGGDDTETILANKHTKELKELAKDYNLFVLLIVHASRGGAKQTRDVSDKARGSEKIIDNCDFYICPSLIQDTTADSTDIVYEEQRGYLRMVNKRGSGRTVDVIYKFDPHRLLMSQSADDPKDVDKAVNKLTNKSDF